MASADISFPSTLWKLEIQTLGGHKCEFFYTIDIYKMAAIFEFFHNGRY